MLVTNSEIYKFSDKKDTDEPFPKITARSRGRNLKTLNKEMMGPNKSKITGITLNMIIILCNVVYKDFGPSKKGRTYFNDSYCAFLSC